MIAREKSGCLFPFLRFYLTHAQRAIPRNFTQIQFGSTCKTPGLRRTLKFAILRIRPDATPHTAWPRNPFYKESNSSGWCGGPHGNDGSGWLLWTYRILQALYIYMHFNQTPGRTIEKSFLSVYKKMRPPAKVLRDVHTSIYTHTRRSLYEQ